MTALVAIVLAVAPDANAGNALMIVLVLLGLAYPVVALNAEDATSFLVVVLAIGAAAGADVLSNIPAIGTYLDGILDGLSTSLYAAVATIAAIRVTNRVKG
ncbi:MAG: hypothetical protein OXG35_05415 [Acidobacteria bacterium]|nr:hypothetical protein [Acidobacteriota bacterium]